MGFDSLKLVLGLACLFGDLVNLKIGGAAELGVFGRGENSRNGLLLHNFNFMF